MALSTDHLSFLLKKDRALFASLSPEKKSFNKIREHRFDPEPSMKEYPAALRALLKNEWADLPGTRTVSAAYAGEVTTLVPAALHEEELRNQHIHLNFGFDPGPASAADPLPTPDCFNIYHQPELLLQPLREHFPQIRCLHDTSVLTETLARQHKYGTAPVLHGNFREDHMDVLAFRGKELVFHNNFHVSTAEDAAYFLLYTREELDMPPESTPLRITGRTPWKSLPPLLETYISQVSYNELPPEIASWKLPAGTHPHEHFTLLCQYLCA